MRQLTLTEERRVEWLDVPDPTLREATDALVRPLAVALCDLDQPILSGRAPFPTPIAMGHEFVAEVVATGDMVELEAGARAVVPFQISCGQCERCARGQTGDCLTVPRLSSFGFGQFGGDWGGALSDLVRVPFADHMLVELPAGVAPAQVASASDNIPDGWRTVAGPLERRPGAPVLILGGGAPSIALYAVDAALALGAEDVTYLDSDPERLRIAEELGARVEQGDPPRSLGPFPVTVDCGASRESLACALRSTEPGGECTSTGIVFEPETPVPLLEMYTSGVHFHIGRAQARPVVPRILELVVEGRLRPELVTSRVVGWDEAPEAVAAPERKLVIERPAAA
ncbi:MAG TPA: alcohol dehydrogenase catalytic domain-containing protein [Thermoleophilaceae bacterium]|jgi:alcohol dehydrogenase|nr:alcohol dehydrogenase catalytic domain-containing protein [Thermoleophilaceae bacterium]